MLNQPLTLEGLLLELLSISDQVGHEAFSRICHNEIRLSTQSQDIQQSEKVKLWGNYRIHVPA